MTKEDKKLLLQDLCARLPYGVKFKYKDWDVPLGLTRIHKTVKYGTFIINERIFEDDLDDIKPYLRPMSSMTKEDIQSFRKWQLMIHAISGETCFFMDTFIKDFLKHMNEVRYDKVHSKN